MAPVKLTTGNKARGRVPNQGSVKIAVGTGPIGPEGPAGPGGSDADVAGYIDDTTPSLTRAALDALYAGGGASVLGLYFPEDFGAIGDGLTDDTAAIQGAIDAAKTAGGGLVVLTKTYAWSGDIVHKSTVSVTGVGTASFGIGGTTLKALDGTARYRFGDLTGDPYPGPLTNLVIDGDTVGGATQLVRMEAVEAVMRDVFIVNGAGDGLDFASSQNCVIDHCSIGGFPTGAAYRIRNRDDDPDLNTQGPGGNKIINCYGHTSNKIIHQDYSVNDVVDPLGFWPHDNFFIGCLFEQYQDTCHSIAHIADGEVQFDLCVFTGSSGMETVSSESVILIENQIRSANPTEVTLTNCYLGGGAVGVDDLIRSVSYNAANILRISGKTNFANAGQGQALCDDRSGGLGVVGGIDGPINLQAGMTLSRGLNGGSGGSFVIERRQPTRYRMDGSQGNPLQLRRDGESFNRFQATRDGNLQWLDGTSATVQANIIRSGAGLAINGANLVQIYATTTALRPAANTLQYRCIFDITLGKPIWSDGTNWVDATGAVV